MPRDRSRSQSREGGERPQERHDRQRRSCSPAQKRRKLSTSPERRHPHRSRSPHRSVSRSRSRSREWNRDRRHRSRSVSSSSSDDRKRRKHKSKKRSASEERERREKKERKRAKREKKRLKGNSQWGKYGVISEADIFTKSQEFHTWLVEERKINPETISKDQNRKEFARFMEDYNTATLPDEKYYNMESYNRRMTALRGGELAPPAEDSYDPQADMKAISSAHKRRKFAEEDSLLNREKLMELRKVQNERVQAGKMRQLGMEVSQSMGVRMDGTAFED